MKKKNILLNKIFFVATAVAVTIFQLLFPYNQNILTSSALFKLNNTTETLCPIINSSSIDSTIFLSEQLSNLNITSINDFNVSSLTNHLILISTINQRAYIFNGTKNNWNLEKEFICSTGLPGTETPKGIFVCGVRGDWFFSEKFNKGAKYYIHIHDCYYMHSVPFYADQSTVAEDILGEPASHGCVRLSVDDAKWIYENVKDRSTIIIC